MLLIIKQANYELEANAICNIDISFYNPQIHLQMSTVIATIKGCHPSGFVFEMSH